MISDEIQKERIRNGTKMGWCRRLDRGGGFGFRGERLRRRANSSYHQITLGGAEKTQKHCPDVVISALYWSNQSQFLSVKEFLLLFVWWIQRTKSSLGLTVNGVNKSRTPWRILPSPQVTPTDNGIYPLLDYSQASTDQQKHKMH